MNTVPVRTGTVRGRAVRPPTGPRRCAQPATPKSRGSGSCPGGPGPRGPTETPRARCRRRSGAAGRDRRDRSGAGAGSPRWTGGSSASSPPVGSDRAVRRPGVVGSTCGQDDPVAATVEGFAHDLLGLAPGIAVGGVDPKLYPGVEGGVDDADAVVMVAVETLAEHHGSEAEAAHLDTRVTQRGVAHARILTASGGEWIRRGDR